jgi:hypothetical protein
LNLPPEVRFDEWLFDFGYSDRNPLKAFLAGQSHLSNDLVPSHPIALSFIDYSDQFSLSKEQLSLIPFTVEDWYVSPVES